MLRTARHAGHGLRFRTISDNEPQIGSQCGRRASRSNRWRNSGPWFFSFAPTHPLRPRWGLQPCLLRLRQRRPSRGSTKGSVRRPTLRSALRLDPSEHELASGDKGHCRLCAAGRAGADISTLPTTRVTPPTRSGAEHQCHKTPTPRDHKPHQFTPRPPAPPPPWRRPCASPWRAPWTCAPRPARSAPSRAPSRP